MNEFRADLHCHTTCSDGSCTPEEIIHMAKKIGLSGLSITDHDTVAAYETALPLAEQLGLEMIIGAEFSTVHAHSNVHVLGYSFSLDNKEILNLCKHHSERRKLRNLAILEKLAKYNISLTYEEVLSELSLPGNNHTGDNHTIGRPHIALAMLKKGYATSIEECFQKYIGDGQPCYVPSTSCSTQETIDIIHKAGGFAIIAHPHLKENPVVMKELLQMNFDGLEGYYAKLSFEQNKKWITIAESKNWMITGGSDFHGTIKPNITLGCSWVNEETFRKLQRNKS